MYDATVMTTCLRNPKCSANILDTIAHMAIKESREDVLADVARHPNVSVETLRDIVKYYERKCS